MAKNATSLQFLRSEVPGKRPDPGRLLAGQPAVNNSPEDPGMFFANSQGGLIKIGPCGIGDTAPNTGAVAPGAVGNCRGEMWLDTAASPGPVLKVYDGSKWVQVMPFRYATAVMQDTAPSKTAYPPGTMWWDTSTGLLYVLYADGSSTQWTQVSSSTVS